MYPLRPSRVPHELICRGPDIRTGGSTPLDVSGMLGRLLPLRQVQRRDYEGKRSTAKCSFGTGVQLSAAVSDTTKTAIVSFAIFADIGYHLKGASSGDCVAMADDEQAVMVVVGAESIRPQGLGLHRVRRAAQEDRKRPLDQHRSFTRKWQVPARGVMAVTATLAIDFMMEATPGVNPGTCPPAMLTVPTPPKAPMCRTYNG